MVLCTQCTPCRASVLLRFFGFEPMTYGAVGYLLCAMLKYFHYVKLKLKSHLILNHLVQFSYFVVVSLFAAFPGIYARSIFSNEKGGGRRMFKHTQYNHLDLQIKKSPQSTTTSHLN